MKIQYKVFESEVKAADDEALVIKHIISSETQDRGGDIMRVAGMRIVGKPVVLMLHGKGPMGSEPVGRPLSVGPDTWKGRPVIMAETQFYPDETGRRLYDKAKNGYLPNWSIGYSVEEAKDILKDGRYNGREVTKWTLLEWSPVGVPMQPDAQTIKDFLDADDAGSRPEIKEEAHWFGLVDEKSCTGCGACEGKHGECSTCKGPMTHFMKEGKHIGSACEKCEPEKFADLTKAIAPPEPPAEDPLKVITEKFVALETMVSLNAEEMKKLKDAWDALSVGFAKLEPLLKTLPPEPEGGKEGEEEPPENPPEKKTPPRLVVVRDDPTPEAEKQAARARILAIAREVINEEAKREIDRMKGRVP